MQLVLAVSPSNPSDRAAIRLPAWVDDVDVVGVLMTTRYELDARVLFYRLMNPVDDFELRLG